MFRSYALELLNIYEGEELKAESGLDGNRSVVEKTQPLLKPQCCFPHIWRNFWFFPSEPHFHTFPYKDEEVL